MTAALLVAAMRDPASVAALDAEGWTALIGAARAEQMIGSLAYRLAGLAMPDAAARILADARLSADQGRTAALWEAEMARRALAPLGVPVVLLKGTAFVAAGLSAGVGRSIGDLDILVPRDRIDAVEVALLAAGWEWVKPDPYDDAYYRQWMHELPPLIHRERDRMIDVHHTILPLTARVRPDAALLLAGSVALGGGLSMLSREDVLVHAAAHLFADGDLAGGLRNLWDVHCLLAEWDAPGFRDGVMARAVVHGLAREMARAMRVSDALYALISQAERAASSPLPLAGGVGGGHASHRAHSLRTAPPPTPPASGRGAELADRLFLRRLLGRDGWGRQRRKLTEFAFYLRGHYLRMPPAMLVRHLWTKWRKGYRPAG